MHPVALVRNILIFAGIAGGGVLAVMGARSNEDAAAADQQAAAAPIVLNTAHPPEPAVTPLNKPISLESGFGRSELTGKDVLRVPENPLDELIFDRSWDISITLTPPKPPTDLPPEKASDEVSEPEQEDTSLQDEVNFGNLPADARKHAEEALSDLREGTRILKEGLKESRKSGQEGRAGREKLAAAGDYFRDARDKLTKALQIAPNHPDLLSLMQETKANLYICMKQGR
ncbi:MAG: hypothetical protein K8I27_06510 [Planctomycetes bacterium]|nr:hypothetical protein [Planctomycetota bacterium]